MVVPYGKSNYSRAAYLPRQNGLNVTSVLDSTSENPTSTPAGSSIASGTADLSSGVDTTSSSRAGSTSTVTAPKASLVSVSTAASVSATTTSTHSPIPSYTGSGSILQGYCATADYALLDDGPTAYWAPVVGCVGDKTDCCPFNVVDPTATKTGGGASVGFPIPPSASATLDRCPDDYTTVPNNGCCPISFNPWSAQLAGQTPCYSTLDSVLTPPPIPESVLRSETASGALGVSTSSAKPTSAVVNVVYAFQYRVKHPKNTLTKKTKAGIGAGAGVAAIIVGALLFLLFWKHRAHKKDRSKLQTLNQAAPREDNPNTMSPEPPMSRYSVPAPPSGAYQGKFGEQFSDDGNAAVVPAGPKKYSADWTPGSPPNAYPQEVAQSAPFAELSGQQQYAYPGTVSPVGSPLNQGATYRPTELYGGTAVHPQEMSGVPEERSWGAPGERTRYD